MSSLKAILAEKSPPALSRCLEVEREPVMAVTFSVWQGREWTFPWSRLDVLEVSKDNEIERAEFHFTNYQVVIIGETFGPIAEAIRNFHATRFRNYPDSFRSAVDPTLPFVSRIDVNPRA